ncbi:MAG: acetyltransferase [Halothiobacillaceae bacterium]|nr:MAG: acetyltransferase [Halothiobacillaceae bacterium]
MYLKEHASGDAVEILDVTALINPSHETVRGRFHFGEELQDPAEFDKRLLTFPSGEALPRCWLDPHWRGV